MDGSSTTPATTLEGGRESAADPELATALAAFTNLDYRDRFWRGRWYEDQCDRIALRALLPATGGRLMDVGAGFGRLAHEYGGYREVVLVDPSDALLDSARGRLGSDPRFTFLSGTAQHLPVADASVDAVVCVRVLHQVSALRPAIAEFARVLRPGGVLVMETANKRNLKAILAWLMRRRRTSPLRRGSEPYVDISLLPHRGACERTAPGDWTASISYLHSPQDVRAWLAAAEFDVCGMRTVALLRPSVVTRHVPGRVLVRLEQILQPRLAALTPGPSLFVAGCRRRNAGEGGATRPSRGAR